MIAFRPALLILACLAAQGLCAAEDFATLIKKGDAFDAALKTMFWGKVKSGVVAGAIVLLLGGGAAVVQHQLSEIGSASMASFEPMHGEWQGIYESAADGKPNPSHPVTLNIDTMRQGRSCDVVMRVANRPGRPDDVYHFTHALNETGDRIITVDDPQIPSALGEGVITESRQDLNAGEWKTSFRSPHPNSDGFTEWHWDRKGDDLVVARHDRIITADGPRDLYSKLRLHRQTAVTRGPDVQAQ